MPKVTGASDFKSGSLVFAGTRVPVQNLFECLAEGGSIKEFFKDYSIVSLGKCVYCYKVPKQGGEK